MKTINDILFDICFKALRTNQMELMEESDHNFTLFDILIDSPEHYTYHEISLSLYRICKLLQDPYSFIIAIGTRRENQENYKWVRFSKEVIKLYQAGGIGKIHLSNVYESDEGTKYNCDRGEQMFNEIFGKSVFK